MQEIINDLKHRGWREDGQVILGPEGECVVRWEDAAKMVFWAHYYNVNRAKLRAAT